MSDGVTQMERESATETPMLAILAVETPNVGEEMNKTLSQGKENSQIGDHKRMKSEERFDVQCQDWLESQEKNQERQEYKVENNRKCGSQQSNEDETQARKTNSLSGVRLMQVERPIVAT